MMRLHIAGLSPNAMVTSLPIERPLWLTMTNRRTRTATSTLLLRIMIEEGADIYDFTESSWEFHDKLVELSATKVWLELEFCAISGFSQSLAESTLSFLPWYDAMKRHERSAVRKAADFSFDFKSSNSIGSSFGTISAASGQSTFSFGGAGDFAAPSTSDSSDSERKPMAATAFSFGDTTAAFSAAADAAAPTSAPTLTTAQAPSVASAAFDAATFTFDLPTSGFAFGSS